MAEDHIRYDALAQEALRGVIHKVLERISRTGLPGEHHLYIAFDTQASGVDISERLREQYPEEMTIVLQYQFWDLEISDQGFEVKLSFNNIPERLVVPYRAIKAFYDPSVQFGLQFGAPGAANDAVRGRTELPAIVNDGDISRAQPNAREPDNEAASQAGKKPSGGPGKVVDLEAFRKK